MDDIAPEYDVVVLGTGRMPRLPAIKSVRRFHELIS